VIMSLALVLGCS